MGNADADPTKNLPAIIKIPILKNIPQGSTIAFWIPNILNANVNAGVTVGLRARVMSTK